MKAKIRELIKGLNQEKNTTVILTTHDMGDVDALCQRIVIIDHCSMIYDNDIEHLKHYFGSYRTLRLNLADSGWKEILVDESKTDVMSQKAVTDISEDKVDKIVDHEAFNN
jgi:ABC-2 type transport system ATP-binding protein